MKLLVFLIYLALIHLLQAYLPPDPVIETHRCASQINYRYNSSQLLCLCVPYTKAITLWRTCGLVASRLARHHCNILNSPFYYVYLPTCSMQQVSSSVCALLGAIHTPGGMAKGLSHNGIFTVVTTVYWSRTVCPSIKLSTKTTKWSALLPNRTESCQQLPQWSRHL